MPRAHCVFLIQATYGSGARKKPWAGGVHDGGRLRPRSANTVVLSKLNNHEKYVALNFVYFFTLYLKIFAANHQ